MEMKQFLTALAPYNVSLKIVKNNYLVTIVFDKSWQVAEPKNKKIHYKKKDDLSIYWGELSKIEFDDIYNEINDVIVKNKEIAMTLELLTSKLDELKKMFAKLPLEKLKRLRFVFDEPSQTTKKRATRKSTKTGSTPRKTNKTVEPVIEEAIDTLPIAPMPSTDIIITEEEENNTHNADETMDSLMEELG